MAPLPCGVTNPCDNPFDFGDACEPSGGGSGGGGVAVPVVVPRPPDRRKMDAGTARRTEPEAHDPCGFDRLLAGHAV